ncbi:NTP transferase domain-containing protein [Kineococcus sp. G2]|uniref:NTP transferase domain-containing protein n=1 Tax=Kineococcus sp. G2 TaxID=3127484 RepID=UPI00301D63D4
MPRPADAVVVVLAGGGGTRFAERAAGADKLAAPLGSSDVLRHLLARLTPCWPVVLVGPDRVAGVPAVREEPPGGGPLAGFAAGLAALDAGVAPGVGSGWPVVLLGGDQPFAAAAVPRLLAALADGGADAVVGVDGSGRRQPLLSAYRRAHARAVVAALPGVVGRPVRELLGARAARVVEVPLEAHEHLDVDVPEDLARARALLAAGGAGAGGAPRT